MAKSKIVESHTKTLEGILDVDGLNGIITLDVEEMGVRNLSDELTKFNGENVKITVALRNYVTE